MSLSPLPSRPLNRRVLSPAVMNNDEDFIVKETRVSEYYLATKPERTISLGFLRQISGSGYINELGEHSTVDWANMWLADYRRLKEFRDKPPEDFKRVLNNMVSFVMYYRNESEVERLPEHLYKSYINILFEALQ